VRFEWSKFWEYLSPDWLWLFLAVAAALAVAVLNIKIPLEMGRLVNVVASSAPEEGLDSYIERLSAPGVRLCGLFFTQGVFTFLYIALLSHVGERFAVRLRTALFHSLMQNSVAFFDTHKTGELVNRLTTDVQNFKSSFKMVVSQGFRGVTQTVGCLTSLYFISPQMTGMVGITVPIMIGIGTIIGIILRTWSQQAQQQVSVATGFANEALNNVRTVRAFAMEDDEVVLYSRELQIAQWYNERLGMGIAAFQSLSNIAINGLVLVVVSHGGILLARNQISPGNLMSFLVATQTIQRLEF
jgi:ATP-binding cassette subfamily B (MDR/TAP) protein 8